MDSIIKQIYLFLGLSAAVFTLTGIGIGYSIGVWKCGKVYRKLFKDNENKFIEEVNNDIINKEGK
ncbi:hypothetical protein [uncultured Clostridium sp.]|uniref:hypothetical protein n=1 Tax=uncultured Clostridium sp. TaxID=59620 RepID=UPI0025F54A23|nr:hypothetical protein [uncultured Clostridium sp.]